MNNTFPFHCRGKAILLLMRYANYVVYNFLVSHLLLSDELNSSFQSIGWFLSQANVQHDLVSSTSGFVVQDVNELSGLGVSRATNFQASMDNLYQQMGFGNLYKPHLYWIAWCCINRLLTCLQASTITTLLLLLLLALPLLPQIVMVLKQVSAFIILYFGCSCLCLAFLFSPKFGKEFAFSFGVKYAG